MQSSASLCRVCQLGWAHRGRLWIGLFPGSLGEHPCYFSVSVSIPSVSLLITTFSPALVPPLLPLPPHQYCVLDSHFRLPLRRLHYASNSSPAPPPTPSSPLYHLDNLWSRDMRELLTCSKLNDSDDLRQSLPTIFPCMSPDLASADEIPPPPQCFFCPQLFGSTCHQSEAHTWPAHPSQPGLCYDFFFSFSARPSWEEWIWGLDQQWVLIL